MRDFLRSVLECGDLETKLTPPPEGWDGTERWSPQARRRPARDPELSMRGDVERLPRPGELERAEARARCLARFAHHELMAVELFAWALLRWPELPAGLRRGWVRILAEEQQHCRLYLERLAAHGSDLPQHVLSDYFWKHAAAIAASTAGPRAFLAAMGLTLEQANLDFAPLYRDAFRSAGDEPSAGVCERVHRDEIGHVAFAARWLRELSPTQDDVERYEAAVPFPLSAARAKGRRFEAGPRRVAGLSEAFVEYVRQARSPQELRGGRGRTREPDARDGPA